MLKIGISRLQGGELVLWWEGSTNFEGHFHLSNVGAEKGYCEL